jgi:hypothetical protein
VLLLHPGVHTALPRTPAAAQPAGLDFTRCSAGVQALLNSLQSKLACVCDQRVLCLTAMLALPVLIEFEDVRSGRRWSPDCSASLLH